MHSMKDAFSRFHPAVNFAYFALVLGFTMRFVHPVCQVISLACAFAYSIFLRGARAARMNLLGLLPLIAVTALLNPLFSHQGVTILAYLPGGNPLTAESVLYGLSAGVVLAAALSWFCCVNEIMTSDKFVYLFGRFAPSLALLLSMTLRFVPRFTRQMRSAAAFRAASGGAPGKRDAAAALSGVAGWAMENAVETADSMKSRGWGLGGRTAYSIYRFERRDAAAAIFMAADSAFILCAKFAGALGFRYYPSVRGSLDGLSYFAFAAYAALCLAPLAVDILEEAGWKALRSQN